MTPEGKVKKKITDILKRHGVYYFMPRGTALGRAGIPDYTCCFFGWFLGIEAKAGKNSTTPLQERELSDIRNHGGIALVINESNLELLDATLKYMKANPRTQVFTVVSPFNNKPQGA